MGDDQDVPEIFSGRPDEGYPADVDLFDDLFLTGTAGDGLLKRIQVDDHQVKGRDLIMLHVVDVLLVTAACQNAAEDLGMECLDTSSQDGGVGGDIFHRRDLHAQAGDEFLCAAGAVKRDAKSGQLPYDLVQTFFVVDGDKCAFDLLCHYLFNYPRNSRRSPRKNLTVKLDKFIRIAFI